MRAIIAMSKGFVNDLGLKSLRSMMSLRKDMMNHNPVETIFALYWLSMYPGLYWFLGRYTWRGLRGQPTMTHFGFKAGWIARIYGVFYIIALIGLTAIIPVWSQSLIGLTFAELVNSFTVRFPADLGMGLVFVLTGLLFYLFEWWIFKIVQKRNPNWSNKIKSPAWFRFYLWSVPSLFVLFGMFLILGAPIALALGFVVIWTYVAGWGEEFIFPNEVTPRLP
jgi:hypothetical protein